MSETRIYLACVLWSIAAAVVLRTYHEWREEWVPVRFPVVVSPGMVIASFKTDEHGIQRTIISHYSSVFKVELHEWEKAYRHYAQRKYLFRRQSP